ncbi:MAG: IS1634 family transposase, partial [Actinobacteria bacterium]|nr:IS1634 family transposase [Actinomycetota bacterium]
YEYISLVEAVRDGAKTGHRVLFRLGEADALRRSGELERIIAALRAHCSDGLVAADTLVAEGAPAVGAVAAVWAQWRRLGLDVWFAKLGAERGAEVLEHAVFAMVANRLVAPTSKRRLPEWAEEDVVAPPGFVAPSAEQYYRALDALADAKEATETQLYGALTDLTNLDLRLVCYDLTSSYFEGAVGPSARFPSRAFGYSRDHRSDRPQVVIGLLCTGDGIPIAHHVFAGNTADVSTLPGVLADLQERFGVGRICVVADRGLISEANVEIVAGCGFDHVIATRLHRDPTCAAALDAAARPDAAWVPVADAHSAACDVTVDGQRCVVVASFERWERDTLRTAELVVRTEAKLLALERRVRDGELVEPAKIGRAAQRILGASPVARLFDIEIGPRRFLYHYDEAAFVYEDLLAGRYVLTTSLPAAQVSAAQVVMSYRSLLEIERRFRVLKDFLHLRPIRHWTERRVRAHVAVCVYATVVEALIARALQQADVRDPDIADQHLSAERALRHQRVGAPPHHLTRPTPVIRGDVVQHRFPATLSPALSR